jgi:hypothetical protein
MEEDAKRKRFLWGIALAWVPWVPAIIGPGNAFTGIANTKATGLGAVAGGFAEMKLMIAAMLISEVSAMVLLFRAFSRGHELRSAFSVVSICASALLIVLFGLSIWFVWFTSHRTS